MLSALLPHTCTINRSQAVGTNGRSQMAQLYTAVNCLVVPMSSQVAIENGFSIGHGYDVYFDQAQDVKTGDQIIWGSDTYVVKNTMPYAVPVVGHIRALCEKEVA